MSKCVRFAMPGSASAPDLLIDTSVAVALLVADHEHRNSTVDALRGRTVGLAGHAAFETFSVLTRMPPPSRRTPATVARMLAANFPESRFLGAEAAADLLSRLDRLQVSGGSIYDALVGAAAREHGLALATRDRRASETYRALEVSFELLA
jgi:predicted nucleic acid-binding protein